MADCTFAILIPCPDQARQKCGTNKSCSRKAILLCLHLHHLVELLFIFGRHKNIFFSCKALGFQFGHFARHKNRLSGRNDSDDIFLDYHILLITNSKNRNHQQLNLGWKLPFRFSESREWDKCRTNECWEPKGWHDIMLSPRTSDRSNREKFGLTRVHYSIEINIVYEKI